MDKETRNSIIQSTVALGALLMSGNIFFVKRLVDEVDETKRMVIELHGQVAVINSQLHNMITDAEFNPKEMPDLTHPRLQGL